MLKNLVDGSAGHAVFLVKQKTVGVTAKGQKYLSLVVEDKDLEMQAKVWSADDEHAEFSAGDFICGEFRASIYNERLQLTISKIEIPEEGTFNKTDFYKSTKYSIDQMYTKLVAYADAVEYEPYRHLLRSFLTDPQLKELLCEYPGAVKMHHTFYGGLLQHTYFVTRSAIGLAQMYHANIDLCTTAAILHDIGKLKELSGYPGTTFTENGVGYGHIVMGALLIHDRAKECGLSGDALLKLEHCVLAHHGELEWGSPAYPACQEAMIVHMADNLDAKLEMMTEVLDTADARQETGRLTDKSFALKTSLFRF